MNYLQLCNAVLRELNEVERKRDLYSWYSNSCCRLHQQITERYNQLEVEWPFNVSNDSDATVDGQRLYSFEADAKTLKWSTFTVQESAIYLRDDSIHQL